MRIVLAGVLALCWCTALPAQDDQSGDAKARADKLKAIQGEMTKATAEARKKIGELKDASEKTAAQRELTKTLTEMRPKLAAKALALAKENPKDDVAYDALVYVNSMSFGTPLQAEAKKLIIENHLTNPKIEDSLVMLARSGRGYDDALLKKVFDTNPSKAVKATVAYVLAQSIKSQAEGSKIKDDDILPKMKEAIAAFEKVGDEYGDTTLKAFRGKAADLAKKEIEAIKKSPIGKETPEIAGEDTDGVNFKISDYRGKVVLLDFWGHW